MGNNSGGLKKINFLTLLNIYLRSFFIQGSFSSKYRQNLGFAFSILPAGKKLYNEKDELEKFNSRHCGYYNGNPFMSVMVMGAVLNMEEKLKNSDGVTEDAIERFKNIAGTVTGSAGDSLFWNALRPASLVLAILCAFFYGLWGMFLFLSLFNVPLFLLKWRWLNLGYSLGPGIITELKKDRYRYSIRFMEIISSVFIAFTAVLIIVGGVEKYYVEAFPIFFIGLGSLLIGQYRCFFEILAGTLGIFIFSFFMLKKSIPQYIIIPLAVVLALVFGMIIVINS